MRRTCRGAGHDQSLEDSRWIIGIEIKGAGSLKYEENWEAEL